MDKLIIKLFGVNRMNLIGWFITGVGIMILALLLFIGAWKASVGANVPPLHLLLGTICLLLLGIFGILLQLYCSLLAEKLEKRQEANRERQERFASESPSTSFGTGPIPSPPTEPAPTSHHVRPGPNR